MGKVLYSLSKIKEIANINNLTCVDLQYISSNLSLTFVCNTCGFKFKSLPRDFVNNPKCSNCELKTQYIETIKTYEEFLSDLNLTLVYDINNPFSITKKTKFNFICNVCGDISYKMIEFIHKDYKCTNCYNIKMYNDAHLLASKKDGYFLSSGFRSVLTPYLWKCKKEHVWITDYRSIKDGHWCPYCNFNFGCLQEMQEIANERGGKCLSDKYIDCYTELIWECSAHHIFKGIPYKVKNNNYWCKKCEDKSTSIGERILKCYIEQIFNKPFIKTRPNWLINSESHKMELDGYNEELMIAFEHNGIQHDEIVSKFKMTKDDLVKRKLDDQTKIRLCKENNVKLIVVNTICSRKDINELKEILKKELIRLEIPIPLDYDNMKIDISKAFKNYNKDKIIQLQNVAISHGGELLTDIYVSSYDTIICKCKLGHIFETTPNAVIQGRWCNHSDCAKNIKNSIEKIKEFALSINIKCLDDEYTNRHMPIKFECMICEYVFSRSFSYINRYSRCPKYKNHNHLL